DALIVARDGANLAEGRGPELVVEGEPLDPIAGEPVETIGAAGPQRPLAVYGEGGDRGGNLAYGLEPIGAKPAEAAIRPDPRPTALAGMNGEDLIARQAVGLPVGPLLAASK